MVETNSQYRWVDGESPMTWSDDEMDEVLGKLAGKIATAARKEDGNFNAVGRDNQVWDSCYGTVKNHLLEMGRIKPRKRRN